MYNAKFLGLYFNFFREKMVAGWLQKCIELEIPCSENYSFQKILGDQVEVRIIAYSLIKIPINFDIFSWEIGIQKVCHLIQFH